MEVAMVANRERAPPNLDPDHILAALTKKSDIGNNTHCVTNLVRDNFHQRVHILHAYRFLGAILDTDVQGTALGVRVAVNPFEALVEPRFLVFDILVFVSLHPHSLSSR